MKVDDFWRAKVVSLDRYRWLLLRRRHGLIGCAFRYIRELLEDLTFGLLALARLGRGLPEKNCDFLLLHASEKVARLGRKQLLVSHLTQKGRVLFETTLLARREVLATRRLKRPLGSVPLRYFGYAAHAEWLVAHFQPKILLNDRNGSLYPPFLRLALHARKGLLVHLAHATTVESSRRLSMNDYDYYFLFGQSSLEALQNRTLRFGDTRLVIAGSYMVDSAYDLPPADPLTRTLLVIGVGPDREKLESYQKTYALLKDWALANPHYQLLVKTHPRSTAVIWQTLSERVENLRILPPSCSLAGALQQASVVVNIMSNAVIEATLARRPVLYVNQGEQADIFSQELFLGPVIREVNTLSQRILWIENNYSMAVEASRQLAEYHLSHGFSGVERCADLLNALLLSQEVGFKPLAATVR